MSQSSPQMKSPKSHHFTSLSTRLGKMRRYLPFFCITCLSCCIATYFILIFAFVVPFMPPYTYQCARRYQERLVHESHGDLRTVDGFVARGMNESLLDVPLHLIKQRGTHNSYHRLYWSALYPPFRYHLLPLEEQLSRGIRHLELDVHYINGEWLVYHLRLIDFSSHCNCLEECLAIIRKWSRDNPGHFPITLWIEPKYFMEMRTSCYPYEAFEKVQTMLRLILGTENIYHPVELQGQHSSLKEAIESDGWPNAGDLRGKFILFMNMWVENAKCRPYVERLSFEEHQPHRYKSDALFFIRAEDISSHYASVLEFGIRDVETIQYHAERNYLVRTFYDSLDDPMQLDVPAQLVAANKVPASIEPVKMRLKRNNTPH